jgi:hypothetical protein
VVRHGDSVTVRANIVHVEVTVAGSLTPLNARFENRPGLVDTSSGWQRAPEAPARTPTAPHDVSMHQCGQGLDVPFCEGFVRLPDRIHAPHGRTAGRPEHLHSVTALVESGALPSPIVQAMRLMVAPAAALALAGCGDEGGETSAAPTTTKRAPPKLAGVAPDASDLAGGFWTRVGANLFARFEPDGTFVIDSHLNWDTPAASGTYELHGSTVTFRDEKGLACRGETWTWKLGLTEEDVLNVRVVEPGCGVLAGQEMAFTRESD